MSAYMIAQIRIDDPETYQRYLAGFMKVFQRYGGELLVTSDAETQVIEGDWALPRTVVMRFPDRARALAWHQDPDYQALAAFRHRSAAANLVLVEGMRAAE